MGFQGIAKETSMLANLASIPHSHKEVKTLDITNDTIPYNW